MGKLTAPMAGTVLQIIVRDGDMVQRGDVLVLLESMKMEIPIESTGNGKVKEVCVEAGDFVDEGDCLISFE